MTATQSALQAQGNGNRLGMPNWTGRRTKSMRLHPRSAIRRFTTYCFTRTASQTIARRNALHPDQKQKRLQINDLQAFGTLAEREADIALSISLT
ncbi:hypothetical protein [Xanthomonas cannabis]|uniref:hypothetical protein n=1 Tax=Xanthomonas cannabis TaxID=1885674 RepID=UPI00141AA7E8|nr:hypothetical protein [Xanthomonas cannabis]NIK62567.1 hypothetical protein [Xanthomonas cannabis]